MELHDHDSANGRRRWPEQRCDLGLTPYVRRAERLHCVENACSRLRSVVSINNWPNMTSLSLLHVLMFGSDAVMLSSCRCT